MLVLRPHRPPGQTCPIELDKPSRLAEQTVEIPSCPDCVSKYDVQWRGLSQTSGGCLTFGAFLTVFALFAIAATWEVAPIAVAATVLLPVAFLIWLAEHRAWRRSEPERPHRWLPHRAAEHPQVARLLEQGWRFKEPPFEPSA